MEWYVLRLGKVEGPFDTGAVDDLISKGSLTKGDMFCKKGETLWHSFESWTNEDLTSQISVSKPWVILKKEVRDEQSFYLQQGPFTTEEIVQKIQSGKVKYSDHVWRNGLSKWTPLHEVDDFFVRSQVAEKPPAYSTNDLFLLKQESIINESKKSLAPTESFDYSEISQQVSSTPMHQLDFNENKAVEDSASYFDQTRLKPFIASTKKLWSGIDSTWKKVVENITPLQNHSQKLEVEELVSGYGEVNNNTEDKKRLSAAAFPKVSKPKDEMEWLAWVLGVILVSMVGMGLFWGFSQVDDNPQAKAESYMDWGAKKADASRAPAQKKSKKAKTAGKSAKKSKNKK